MSEDADRTGQGSAVYQPFPSFVEWELGDFDSSDFERYSARLVALKESARPDVLKSAMDEAQRSAAVDTNAIEGIYETDRGFTRTVATQAASWELQMSARGPHVRPAFDDALQAYDYVLDAATQDREVTELWIKELHAILTNSQADYTVFTPLGPDKRPLPKGVYKTMPNSPTLTDGRQHAYAPVDDTSYEMGRLVKELQSEAFRGAHPVIQAAYAHYAFVCVHPFADGNGRVARALSSVYLYRRPGVPLIVFADQRNDYYDALAAADQGDPFPFVRFMLVRTVDAIGIIVSRLDRTSPPKEDSLAALNKFFNSGADVQKLRSAAQRLRNLALADARVKFNDLNLPADIKPLLITIGPALTRVVPAANLVPPGTAYRDIGEDGFFTIQFSGSFPKPFRVACQVETFMKNDDSAPSELLLATRRDDGLEVWVEEIDPVEKEALRHKVSNWIDGKIAELLDKLSTQLNGGS